LITVAIIGILAAYALKDYKSALRAVQPGGGSSSVTSPGAGNAMVINQLRQIHTIQLAYHQRYGKYATFEELVADGSIPQGYAAREDDPQGVAFIRWYDLEFNADANSYVILAFPNSAAAAEFPNQSLPAYRIDQSGEVKEEEGLDDGSAVGSDNPFGLDPADTGADFPEELPDGESEEPPAEGIE
ncbi:MAG TPA: hypothetical protein VEI97_02250, partial [bacterium]|nr:hypothetical protein [bacterium]